MTAKKESKVISGMALYAAVQKPKTKYQKDGSKNPLDFVYAIDLVVDAKVFKEMGKRYPKQKKEPLSVEDFKKRYGIDPPENIARNSDDEVCMMSFKTSNAYTDKQTRKVMLSPKPKVFFKNDQGKLVEDTTTMIGNGSMVAVQWIEYENKQYNTTSYKLKAVRVDDLVPYETESYDELGEVDESSLKDSGYSEATENAEEPPFDTDEDDLYD